MARIKISEYQAKTILSQALKQKYAGLAFNSVKELQSYLNRSRQRQRKLVVKVDQGIKARAKQGLIAIHSTPGVLVAFVKGKRRQGFRQFLIEPFIEHKLETEQYLTLERTRGGIKVLYSSKGGIEIEHEWDHVQAMLILYSELAKPVHISPNKAVNQFITKLIRVFEEYYFSFLEINPLVLQQQKVSFLDLAVEVDDGALTMTKLAQAQLVPVREKDLSPAEIEIKELDLNTPASLKLNILNPNGSLWLLLSGGGASIVLADEIADLGFGKSLANYGEYSGNPTTEDTYLYTLIILKEMLKAKSKAKKLIIAGGVANFTDVVKTFKGIIQALNEFKFELKKQGVKVYVRRGGPNQKTGLAMIKEFLETNGLYGTVMGPDKGLTEVVRKALC